MRLDKIIVKELEELNDSKLLYKDYRIKFLKLKEKYSKQSLLFEKVLKKYRNKYKNKYTSQNIPKYSLICLTLFKLLGAFEVRFKTLSENHYYDIEGTKDFAIKKEISKDLSTALKYLLNSTDDFEGITGISRRLDLDDIKIVHEMNAECFYANFDRKSKADRDVWNTIPRKDYILIRELVVFSNFLDMLLKTDETKKELYEEYPNNIKDIDKIIRYMRTTNTKLRKNFIDRMLDEVSGVKFY